MRIELELQKQRRLGLAEGKMMEKIELVCKKLSKGKSPKTIAEDLEEDPDVIEQICKAAQPFAPDYDVEAIYEAMQAKKSGDKEPGNLTSESEQNEKMEL